MPKRRGKKKGRRNRWNYSQHCGYCKRIIGPPTTPMKSTSFTKDHVTPKLNGGRKTIPCCHACNNLKGCMSIEVWRQFMKINPEWWKLWKGQTE